MIYALLILTLSFLFLGYFLGKREERKKWAFKDENPFIKAHQSLMQRDDMYKIYVDWCYKNKTTPLENFEFFSELENNKRLRDQVYKILND